MNPKPFSELNHFTLRFPETWNPFLETLQMLAPALRRPSKQHFVQDVFESQLTPFGHKPNPQAAYRHLKGGDVLTKNK